MRAAALTFGRVLARSWPALLAWYLAGALVRSAVIALAAPIGPENTLAALLLVPLAVLARLVSYIGMFLTVRSALTNYRVASGGVAEPATRRGEAAEFLRVLIAAIIPFFALYTLIGELDADLTEYARAAFRYSFGSDTYVLDVGDGPLVAAVVVVAFGARMLLRLVGRRLPGWVVLVEIYLEATWVFVALTGLRRVFGLAIDFIQGRRVVVWYTDAVDAVREVWDGFRVALDAIGLGVPVLVGAVLLPLAWLLVAGVVATRSLSSLRWEALVSARLRARVRLGLQRLPRSVLRRTHLVTDEWADTWRPLSNASRIILRSGPRYLAAFVAAYALLSLADAWLVRGVYRVIGAHDNEFWYATSPLLTQAVAAVVEPVRVALLAAAFDGALGAWLAASGRGPGRRRGGRFTRGRTGTPSSGDPRTPAPPATPSGSVPAG